MSLFQFTPEDQMQPVYCVGCRQHIPRAVSTAGRGLCPTCLAKLQGMASPPPTSAPPPAAGVPSMPAAQAPNRVWLWGVATVCVAFGVGYPIVGKVRADRQRAGLQTVLARLQQRYPDRRFAIGMGDGTVPFHAKLSDLQVDEVDVTQRKASVRTKVRFSAIHSGRNVKPKIFVSAFDEKGRELGRAAVVEHLFDDLEPGGTDTTTDEVPLKGNGVPVIFAVDDDPEGRRIAAFEAEQERLKGEQALSERRREEAVRGPKPEPSSWDGITPEANAWLKRNLRDYESMQLMSCSIVVPWGDDAWVQHVKYRARNGFGGLNLVSQGFVIRNRTVIDVIGGDQ